MGVVNLSKPVVWFLDLEKSPKRLIYDRVFKLHYIVTATILFCLSALGILEQWGEPIMCWSKGVPDKVLNQYCWIQGTFTVPGPLINTTGEGMIHQGITGSNGPQWERQHVFYLWLNLILVGQAILYLLPGEFWRRLENGKMTMLVQDLYKVELEDMLDVKDKSDDGRIKVACKRRSLVLYFVSNLGRNNLYAAKYVLMEFLNLLNVVGQVYLMNLFFDGEFLHYGLRLPELISKDYMNREDKLTTFFPRVGKCTFRNYAASGSVDVKDALCVLPFNMAYEKIYIFLWYWTCFLAFVTICHFVVRLLTILSLTFRKYQAMKYVRANYRSHIYFMVSKCGFGDWLILLRLLENVPDLVMQEILRELRMVILGQKLPPIPSKKSKEATESPMPSKKSKEATEYGKNEEVKPAEP